MKRRSKKPPKLTSKPAPKLTKGMPSAVILSIVIHAVLFLLAGMLVVFTVKKVKEPEFEAPKAVERPKMKLRKPKVRIKKSSKPKSTTRITTKNNRATMPDIQLPEMGGMGSDIGNVMGTIDMPELEELSVWGSERSIGNDFVGQLYDLKYSRTKRGVPMEGRMFLLKLDEYARGGWKESTFSKYWRAPNKLFTTHFMVPPNSAHLAPEAFGCPQVESYYFFVKYEGKLVYKEDIKFRFWGIGDAYIYVAVNNETVLLDANPWPLNFLNSWLSTDADNDKYYLADKRMRVGDWIELKAGEPVDMKVFFGEWAGGLVSGVLLVEVEGVEYPKTRQGGPLLPAFKTAEFTRDQLDYIYRYLPEGECTLTNGPIFRDY